MKYFYRTTSALIIIAAAAALITTALFSRSVYQIDGLTLSLRAAPAWRGTTEISIPPAGTISAATHKAPVKMTVGLERMSLGGLKKLADTSLSKRSLFKQAERQARRAVNHFILKLIFLSAAAGLGVGFLLPPRRWYRGLIGAASGALIIFSLITMTYTTFDYHAFRSPRYSGVVSAAPWLVSNIEDKLNSWESFRGEVKKLAVNLSNFYDGIEKIDTGFKTDGLITVLHISDIHNNPAGLQLAKKVASEFNVDFTVDTGDISDFGTPIEADLAAKVREFKVPYVFIPGNHDSPRVSDKLSRLGNVVVLNNSTTTIKGINIAGFPDMNATSDTSQKSLDRRDVRRRGRKIAAVYRGLSPPPDIVAVHNPLDAARLIGRAPLILAGHTHKPRIRKFSGTLIVNAGTTGAAGLRTLKTTKGVPYTLKILYFQKNPVKLRAVDSITIMGLRQEFVLQRSYFGKEAVSSRGRLKNLPISVK